MASSDTTLQRSVDSEGRGEPQWAGRAQSQQHTCTDLTPARLALAEQALAALHGAGIDADTSMSIFRAVTAYVHGATSGEIGMRQLMADQGWTGSAETRTGLAGRMTWLLNTGRYPTFARYIQEGARKDDPQWQFDVGLDALLDGIDRRTSS
ncbi:TetR/AcrR family transcriptional regulator C-terminal domain-containing protein [Micromonosporaceae bacterium Da 78-11]